MSGLVGVLVGMAVANAWLHLDAGYAAVMTFLGIALLVAYFDAKYDKS